MLKRYAPQFTLVLACWRQCRDLIADRLDDRDVRTDRRRLVRGDEQDASAGSSQFRLSRYMLDWFHLAMCIQHVAEAVKG
jgi:hypothetical protein